MWILVDQFMSMLATHVNKDEFSSALNIMNHINLLSLCINGFKGVFLEQHWLVNGDGICFFLFIG